jgi:hypothetical protein
VIGFGCGENGTGSEGGVQEAGTGGTGGTAGPQDAGPGGLQEAGTGGVQDAGPGDDPDADTAAPPDVGVFPTAPPPDLGLPDSAHLCDPPDGGAPPPPPPTLENAAPVPPIEVGGPAGVDQVVLANLDGDAAASPEVVLIRGGRVLSARPDGRVLWQTEGFSARYLADLVDLNGDGRPEVVARSARDVRAFDAISGVLRWSLPARPLGDDAPPMVGVQRLVVGDVDADALPDLQVGDGGCGSSDGTGNSAFFGFANVRPDPATGRWQGVSALPIVPSPGRCARWQTQVDFDDDGAREIVVPTRTGVHVVDPRSGAVRLCLDGAAEFNTQALHRVVQVDATGAGAPPEAGRPEILVFSQQRTFLLEPSGTPAGGTCPPDAGGLAVRWSQPVVAPRGDRIAFWPGASPEQSARVAVGAWQEAAGHWTTTMLDAATGEILATVADRMVWGPADLDGRPDTLDLLAYAGAARTPAALGDLRALSWDEGTRAFTERWAKADAAPLPRRHPASEADRATDFREAPAFGGRVLLLRYDPQTLAADRLETVAVDGTVATYDARLDASGTDVLCTDACRAAIALSDGRVGFFDDRLNLLAVDAAGHPALSAPSGTASLLVTPGGEADALIAVSTTGTLGRLEPTPGPARWAWSAPLGTGDAVGRPLHLAVPGTPGLVVRRDYRAGPTVTWAFFDVETGDRVGAHALPAADFVPQAEAVALDVDGDAREDLIRFDRALTPDAPDERCPAREVTRRVVTAVSGATRETLWQTSLRPGDPCRGASSERLSSALHRGVPALFVTESNTIRRLDPTDGREVDRADLDDLPSAMRSGGWIMATGLDTPALLRVGGNGPIEARDAELDLVWRADDALAVGNRSWRDRPGAVVGRQVWVSPAPGAPVVQLGLDGETAGQVEGELRLQGGIEVGPDAPAVAELSPFVAATGLSAEVDGGLLVTGDDGWLYGLDLRGAVVFARFFGETPGRPEVGDLDADGVQELVAPVADGTIALYEHATLGRPPEAWDLPCPPDPQCDPAADIDRTTNRTELCAEWIPSADAEGYLVRVVGPNGAAVSAWQNAGALPVTRIDDLELVAGSLYCVEVRAWRQPGAQLELSDPVVTDCVLVLDETPPTVALEVPDDRWAAGDPPLDVRLVAHDDEGLAAWRVELWNGRGESMGVLWSGAAAGTDWTVDRTFTGRDGTSKTVPTGTYELRGYAQDVAGAEAFARAAIEICDLPCP